jgi:hypothetical protein
METQPQKKEHCEKPLTTYDKWRFTLYTTFVLILLFNPWAYMLVNSILSGLVGMVANKYGCPTLLGFGIHTVIFTIIIRLLMDMHI